MVQHLILGLLRHGTPSYAYALSSELTRRAGASYLAQNVGRELRKLKDAGLVTREANAPGADERRIPFAITPEGCDVFDEWLLSPQTLEDEFSDWLLFIELVAVPIRIQLLERHEDELWTRIKILNRAVADAGSSNGNGHGPSSGGPLDLLRRKLSVELELVRELLTALRERSDSGIEP